MSTNGNQLTEFINYLLDFGFLSKINVDDFTKIFNISQINELSTFESSHDNYFDSLFKEKIIVSVVNFLNNLTNENKRLLALNLLAKFNEKKNKKNKTELAKLFYNKYKINKLYFYIQKWKNFIINNYNKMNKSSSTSNLKKNNSIKNQFLQNSKNENSFIYKEKDYKSNSLSRNNNNFNIENSLINKNPKHTSQEIKEIECLKECSFHPLINSYSNKVNFKSKISLKSENINFNPTISNLSNKTLETINRLYNDNKFRKEKIELKQKDKLERELKEHSFKPNINSYTTKKIKENFNQRLKSYNLKKNNSIQKITSQVEEDYNKNFTFYPNISLSQKSFYKSFSCDKIERIPSSKLEKKDVLEDNINRIYNSQLNDINNNFDYSIIENLYNDYKKSKIKLDKKRELLNLEQGITFQPESFTNKKYFDKVNLNFNEREKNFINLKQQFVQDYIDKEECEKNNKKYSKKEKEKIVNNIINKLYKEGLEKYKNRFLQPEKK